MALNEKSTLTQPIEINATAGTSSDIAILEGTGAPDGNSDPQSSAAKGSLYIRSDATDDESPLYLKVDNDGADDDWVPVIVEKDEADKILEGHLTLDADKKLYLRGTDNYIHSNSGSKIAITAPSGVDLSRMTVGTGTYISSMLAGSGTAVFGALGSMAASSTSLAVTGLTQNHKCIFSPSGFSACLQLTDFSCSPGGGVLTIGVVNTASTTTGVITGTFSYMAVTDVA